MMVTGGGRAGGRRGKNNFREEGRATSRASVSSHLAPVTALGRQKGRAGSGCNLPTDTLPTDTS